MCFLAFSLRSILALKREHAPKIDSNHNLRLRREKTKWPPGHDGQGKEMRDQRVEGWGPRNERQRS
jgi:hypothetical protein